MQRRLYCKILAIGIIVLFIGVGIHPAFANVVNKSLVDDNHPPNKPKIDGPEVGRPGTHEWTFCATDPDGDNVSYQIDWDDGTYENWTDFYPSGEVITRRHTYNIYGDFELDAYAKDIYGLIGPKGTYPVIMTQSKQNEEDCNCKEIDCRHLAVLEKQLNKLEVYSKLLLVLSRDNPELREISEELSFRISISLEWFEVVKTNIQFQDKPFICYILEPLYDVIFGMLLLLNQCLTYYANPLLQILLTPFYATIIVIYFSLDKRMDKIGCITIPPPPILIS